MENMWLTSESLGLGMHILTVFSDSPVDAEVRELLKIKSPMKIAFACSLGHPAEPIIENVHVRRDLDDFVHHNTFGHKDVQWSLELNKRSEE